MKTLTRAIHIVVVLMLAVGFVSAGTLNLTFNNASGATYPGTSDLTYPYNFTISGYSGQQLMCMDFTNNISGGQSWSATYAVIGTSSPLIDQQSAWLFLQGILGNATMVDANGAVWYLNDGGTAPPLTPGSQNLISSLPTSFTAADLLGPVIEYTPINWSQGNGPQRFLGYNTVTPEPGTLFLLGGGVLAFAGVLRRKLAV